MRKTYKNIAEEEFCKWIEKEGFTPQKRGWPDFFCSKWNGDVIFVEVKDTATNWLKKEQFQVMQFLVNKGILCYRWDLQTRTLQPVTPYPLPQDTAADMSV